MRGKNGSKDFSEIMGIMNKKASLYFTFMIADNAIVSICYNIVLAFILKEIIDAIAYHDIKMLQRAFFIAIISFLTAFIFEPVTRKIMNYCVRSTVGKLRKETFKHIEDIKVKIYENYSAGDILSRLTKDVDALEDIYLKYIPNLCFAVIHGVVAMVAMIYMNSFLGIFAIVLGLLSVLANYFNSKRIKVYSEEYQKESGNLSQNIIDMQDGFIDIKMSCSEEYFCNKFKSITKKLRHNYEMRENCNVILETINILAENINSIGLMALGLFMTLKGYTTIGVVVSIISLQGNASFLFQNFSTFLGGIQKVLPSARRVLEIFEMKTEECSDTNLLDKKEIKKCKECISIKDLIFSYDGVNNILNGISMSVNHGDFVGIMGESGQGKSTFVKILLGFYPPTAGVYKLNGKCIDDINISELRNEVAYVDQDCHLFQQTVEENVRFGNQNATKEEVLEACKLANAHDFIMKLEDGYNTKINETCDNISGGQRQRIAIARALVSKREILLIDEGTAELDLETEKIISNMIKSLMGEKTIIVITHKPSIIDSANIKYRFVEGKVG